MVADPARPGTILELVGDVAVIYWLLGDAQGEPDRLEALHATSLEALLERLVDTPVRGFIYEAGGGVPAQWLRQGAGLTRSAAETWRIPVEIVGSDPAAPEEWLDAMFGATQRLLR